MGRFDGILLTSDFDHTLSGKDYSLPKEQRIPAANITAIRRFMEEGGRFTVATGRAKVGFAVWEQVIPRNAPCIMVNGAHIYEFATDETFRLVAMPERTRADLIALMARFPDVTVEIYRVEDVYAFGESAELDQHSALNEAPPKRAALETIAMPWVKVVLSGPNERLWPICDHINRTYGDHLSAVITLPFLLELTAAGIEKGDMARWLADRLGCPTLVCVGDGRNDISMLEEADLAFVPADATPELLQRSYRVAAPCGEGAVASVIQQLEKL